MSIQIQQPNDEELNLTETWMKIQEWWTYLWKRKAWILAIAFIFSVGGYLRVKFAKPVYSASLTFSLEQGGGSGTSLSGLASQFGFSIGSGGSGMFAGENLLTLMKSRRMIQDVLLTPCVVAGDTILLIDQYVRTSPGLMRNWNANGLYPFDLSQTRSRKEDSAIGVLYDAITQNALAVALEDKKQSFVTLRYSGHDELFTGAFVEQLANQATNFYLESKTGNSRENINKLQRRVDSVTSELERAMFGAASSLDQNAFTVQSTAKVSSLQKQMKVTMLTTLYGELVKNLEISKTMAVREEPLITVIDRPHYPFRVPESGFKGALLGGALGGFLSVLFFAGREFLRNLNRQVAEIRRGEMGGVSF